MSGTRFIVAGNFIDGTGTPARRNIFLAVNNSVITDIGPATNLPQAEKADIDDFSHCTIVPALIDCSVSLSRSPSLNAGPQQFPEKTDSTEKQTLLAQHIRNCHAHGVLGVADCENLTALINDLREKTRPDGMINICSAVPFCDHEQGCTSGKPATGDFIRIVCSSDIESGESLSPLLAPDTLNQILQQRDGRNMVVVANGREQVEEALAAGCAAIEQGYGMGKENLKTMAANNVLWIPSVLRAKNSLDSSGSGGSVCCRFSQRYIAPGKPIPGAEAYWKKVVAEQLAQLQFARQLGVKTALGTGAGSNGIIHGESMVEEMKLFIKAGYSLEETIGCASANGAEFFGMENLGTLTVGKKATFLIARGTVKQLPRKLSYLEGIYIDGTHSTAYRKNP